MLSRNFALSEAFIPSCIESIDGFMVVFFIHHVPTGPDRILARRGAPLFYIFAGENVMSLFYGISSHYYSFLFSIIDRFAWLLFALLLLYRFQVEIHREEGADEEAVPGVRRRWVRLDGCVLVGARDVGTLSVYYLSAYLCIWMGILKGHQSRYIATSPQAFG